MNKIIIKILISVLLYLLFNEPVWSLIESNDTIKALAIIYIIEAMIGLALMATGVIFVAISLVSKKLESRF